MSRTSVRTVIPQTTPLYAVYDDEVCLVIAWECRVDDADSGDMFHYPVLVSDGMRLGQLRTFDPYDGVVRVFLTKQAAEGVLRLNRDLENIR